MNASSTCGPCPSGWATTPEGCREIDGCRANPRQAGSTTPCAPGVACSDVPAGTPGARATAFTCGACPPGYAGDGVSCFPCTLQVSIPSTSFSGSSVPRSRDAFLYGSAAPPPLVNGFACSTSGGLSFRWTGDSQGYLIPLSSEVNQMYSATLFLPGGTLTAGVVSRFLLEARDRLSLA